MAEVTGMRNNALPYPVYGQAWAVVFPMLDADGDLVTGATTPDAEVSKNGDTFADCTNESTEIATSSGVYYLLLTAAEMTADIVTVIAKSATAGMKTTVITLYPRKLVVLSSGTCQGANDTGDIQLASGDSAIDDYYNGCLCVAVIDGTTEARIINDYVGSTKVAEIYQAWNTAIPDSNDTYTIYLPEGRQVSPANVTHVAGAAQTAGDLAALVTTVDGVVDTILVDTNELQTDWTNAGRLDLILDIIAADTTTDIPALLTASAIATAVWNAATATYGSAGSYGLLIETDLDAAISSRMATYTQPTGFLTATFPSGTVANTTNITAGAITTVATVTNQLTAAQIAAGVWQDTTAGDFTVALSIGKTVVNGVTLGTGLTINAYTGNTPQTGDSFARIGPAGASLTDLGGMSTTMKAQIEQEVNDAIDTAIAELGVAAPTATPTLRTGMMLMYMALRNKLVTQTSGTDALEIYNNAGTMIAKKLLTDDGSDYTEAEMVSG